jgi:mannose-1-phosphate guanylyltransferase/mannose-6-phosphate isomerase
MASVYPVILSGGSGTRLWPLSRKAHPKQFLTLIGGRSLLQETALRVLPGKDGLFGPLTIIGNETHHGEAERQLAAVNAAPALHVLEPLARNTAPAAAIAALAAQRHGAEAVLALLPADHAITDVAAFHGAMSKAAEDAKSGRIVTFGIVPTGPETGYGYIRRADTARPTGTYPIAEFVEKPDLKTAERYVAAGSYLWNSGMFVARADVLLAEMAHHCPAILDAARAAFDQGKRNGTALKLDPERFGACPSDSIDYALMERTDKASVLPARMGWNDVGSWAALYDLAPKDETGNALAGDVITIDTARTYIHGDGKLIATIGLEDLVIIDTRDALLIARRDKVQDVKAVIEKLAKAGRPER